MTKIQVYCFFEVYQVRCW